MRKNWQRTAPKLVGKAGLAWYHGTYYRTAEDAVLRWEQSGEDLLFHGASAAIVVGSKQEASCPAEDALLATQNILLAAHSMGLGTCLIGFVIEAMKYDKNLADYIGLPNDETPYTVIALGHPAEKYQQVAGGKPQTIRYFKN